MSTPVKGQLQPFKVWIIKEDYNRKYGQSNGDIMANGNVNVIWYGEQSTVEVLLDNLFSDNVEFNAKKKRVLESGVSEFSYATSYSDTEYSESESLRGAPSSPIKEVKDNDIYTLLEDTFLEIIQKKMNESDYITEMNKMSAASAYFEIDAEKKKRLKDGNATFRKEYWNAVRNSRDDICRTLYGFLNDMFSDFDHAQVREFRLWGRDAYSSDKLNESKLYIALTRYIDTTNAQRPVNSQVTHDMLGKDTIDINTNRMSQRLLWLIRNEDFSRIERVVSASSVFNPEQLKQVWQELSTFQLTQDARLLNEIKLEGTVKLMVTRANNDHRHDNDITRTKLTQRNQDNVNAMMTVCADKLIEELDRTISDSKASAGASTSNKCTTLDLDALEKYTTAERMLAKATTGHTEKASMLQTVQYLQANGVKIASVDEDTMIADTTTACAARELVKNSMGVRTEDISRDGNPIPPIYSLHASHDAGISITGAKTGLICLAYVQYDMCDGSVQIIQEVIFTDAEGNEQDSQTAETTGIDIRTTMNILDVHGNTIGTGSNHLEYLKKSAEGDVIFAGGALTLFNAAHFVWMPNLRAYSDGPDKIDRDNVHNYFNIFIRNIMAKWWGDYGIHFLMLLGADVAAQSQNDVIYCSDLSNSEATSGSIVTLLKSNETVRTFDRIIHGTNDQLAFADSVLLAHFGLYKGKLPAAMLTCKDKGVVMLMTCRDSDGVKIRILKGYTYDDCGGGEDEDGDGEDGHPGDAVKHPMLVLEGPTSDGNFVESNLGKVKGSPKPVNTVNKMTEVTTSAEYDAEKKEFLRGKSSARSKLDSNVNPNAGGGTRRKRIPHKSNRTRKARRARKTKRKSKRTRRARKSSRKAKTRRRVKK